MTGPAGLPASLAANPRLSAWLDFSRDGEVVIRTGKVEYGQGIWTALAQIAAEELGVGFGRVRVAPVSTATSPDEGITSGSRSVQDSGAALRAVCAQARSLLLAAAAAGERAGELAVSDGRILADGRDTGLSYWSLAQPGLLERDADGAAPGRPAPQWQVAGRSAPRLDLPDKVTGRPRFLHDLVLPGMVHGRAARQLARAARWQISDSLPDENDLAAFLRSSPAQTLPVASQPDGRAAAAAASTVTAEFTRPFIAHASMGPSCAIARWDGEDVTVWSHSQGIFALRGAIADGLGLAPSQVTVHHAEGPGAYGHNGADDVAMDAVLLARAAGGRPVRVAWTREDELGWAPYGSAMLVAISAGIDAGGRIVSWRQDVWSNGYLGRPGTGGEPRLLALSHRAGGRPLSPAPDGPATGAMGSTRNAVPGYDIPDLHVTRHRLLAMPVRTSSQRSLGAFGNVFAIESVMDELAGLAGADPVEFRLAHLSDPRARRVLTEAAALAGWQDRPRGEGTGYGVGFARYKGLAGYCAAVAEVEAVTEVRVRRLWLAVDVGTVINPDGVVNQVEGGAVQAASWALRERVRFSASAVTSVNWDSYPILRFTEVPEVSVRIVAAPGEPETGAGEVAQGPVAGAIGNAVADAVGVRVRDLPLTAEQVARAIERS